jgi:hypothetical protein
LFVYCCAAGCLLLLVLLGPSLAIYKAQVDPTQQQLEMLQTTVAALINPRITLTVRAMEFQTATNAARLERTNALVETNNAATNAAYLTVTVLAQTATLTPSSTPTSLIDATELYSTLMADVAQRFTETSGAPLTQTATAGYAYTVNAIILQTLGITATATPSATSTPSVTATPSNTYTPSMTPAPSNTPTALPKQQIIESDVAQVRRVGQWQVYQSDFASGGSFMVSGDAGNESLTVSFRGTAVDVVYVKAQQLGLFAIEVDGKWIQTIDSSSTKSEFDSRVQLRGLKLETHRLRVYALRGSIAIDAFIIEPQNK